MRIAIVNDVMMAVEAVRRVIAGSSGHQLAWIALDGEEAVERCAADTPDLILMDLIMPRMDGIEATRQIMTNSPCAIVVVTASVNDNSSRVFEAMGAGALDAVNTPVLESPGSPDGAKALLAKIETIRKLIGAPAAGRTAPPADLARSSSAERPETLVAIGASAGGPAALAKVLSQLPSNFPAPIVLVQHVDVQFAKGLADGRAAALELYQRLRGDNRFVTGSSPELDILVWAPRAASVTEASNLSKRIFAEAASRQLHLALVTLPLHLLDVGDMRRDRDTIICLRSVLMKPEHREWADRIWAILGDATKAAGVR
jgi:two-component system response regulator WspF